MISRDELVQVYAEIAGAYERRGQDPLRDRFLVLAAAAALSAGQPGEADRLRRRLLSASPHHLVKPYATFAQAMEAPDFLAYVNDLRKHYEPEAAEELLANLQREDEADHSAGPNTGTVDLASTAAEPPIYKLRTSENDTVRQPMALPPTMPPGTRPPAFGSANAGGPAAPRAVGAPNPAVPLRPATPARPTAPSGRPGPLPISVSLPPRSPGPSAPDEEGGLAGSWLAAMLFGIVLTGGAILLAYTLARPYLPAGIVLP